MKTATVIATEFEVICPDCKDGVTDPYYGSFRWTTDESKAGQVVECECGARFKLPKVVPSFRLGERKEI